MPARLRQPKREERRTALVHVHEHAQPLGRATRQLVRRHGQRRRARPGAYHHVVHAPSSPARRRTRPGTAPSGADRRLIAHPRPRRLTTVSVPPSERGQDGLQLHADFVVLVVGHAALDDAAAGVHPADLAVEHAGAQRHARTRRRPRRPRSRTHPRRSRGCTPRSRGSASSPRPPACPPRRAWGADRPSSTTGRRLPEGARAPACTGAARA